MNAVVFASTGCDKQASFVDGKGEEKQNHNGQTCVSQVRMILMMGLDSFGQAARVRTRARSHRQ